MYKKGFIELIRRTVIDVAINEDRILANLVNKGIFFVPEVAFAYLVGKHVIKECAKRKAEINWDKEQKLQDGYGFADLVFRGKDIGTIVMEIKMADTIDAYNSDVLKLQKLGRQYEKIFCALVDVYRNDLDKDRRIKEFEETLGDKIQRIGDFYHFTTEYSYSNYQKPICCLIGLWKID